MENQENWNVIDSFLKLNLNYKLESIDKLAPREWINKKNCLETFPPRDNVCLLYTSDAADELL